MRDMYILKDGVPTPCDDVIAWGKWLTENRDTKRVAVDIIGETKISTVFLGLDHQWGDGPPLLYETMIFGGPHDDWQERCSTREEALQMHERAKALVIGLAH